MQATGDNKFSWALLGATRGLGRALYQKIKASEPNSKVLLFGRSEFTDLQKDDQLIKADFSDEKNWTAIGDQLLGVKRVVYLAAGGPYGQYSEKTWASHLWAYRVSFLFPAFLTREILHKSPKSQFSVVGSSVAENRPDPMAGSYAASKHALLGLISSVQREGDWDLRLFSPGYMDTRLLPPNAWPRQDGIAKDPAQVAEIFYEWLLRAKDDTTRHLIL